MEIKEGDIYIYKGNHSHFLYKDDEYYKVDKEYIVSDVAINEFQKISSISIKGDQFKAWHIESFNEYFKKKINKDEVKPKPHFQDLSVHKEYVLWDNQCLPHGNFVSNAKFLGTIQTLSRYKHAFKIEKENNIHIVDDHGHNEYGNEFTIWDKKNIKPKKWYVNLYWSLNTSDNTPILSEPFREDDMIEVKEGQAACLGLKFIKTIELTNE